MIKNKEINEKIVTLKIVYRKDPDALDEIERRERDIIYLEGRGEVERAKSAANNLEAHLHDWY